METLSRVAWASSRSAVPHRSRPNAALTATRSLTPSPPSSPLLTRTPPTRTHFAWIV